MKVQKRRWGEVTIKKQGQMKNAFDLTKSFSVSKSNYNYSISQYREILELVTNLTDQTSFKELKGKLKKVGV